jgi:hypothetical protein
MSKYQPLSRRLSGQPGDEWPASFSELERVLGFALPKAARTSRAWWGEDRSHSRAWTAHGWAAGDVDLVAERVTFRRSAASPATIVQAAGLRPLADPEPTGESADDPTGLALPARSDPEGMAGATRMPAGLIAAGLALVAGAGALAVRALVRRR